jgi:hypothetical protein
VVWGLGAGGGGGGGRRRRRPEPGIVCFIDCMPDRASRHHFRGMANGLYDIYIYIYMFYGFAKREMKVLDSRGVGIAPKGIKNCNPETK